MTSPGSLDVRFGVKRFLRRLLRDGAPGRRLRVQLATEAVERHALGRDSLRLLDAGSEEGLLCLRLARRHPGWLLVAADIATAPLRRGRRWAREEGLDVAFVQWDLTRFLGDEVFDVVVALESLVEIPDDRAALRAMARALRPGGLFVAQVPTADWTPVLKGAERTWRREARHGYGVEDLSQVLAELDLDRTELRPTFRRLTAMAQDIRDRAKTGGAVTQVLLFPLMAAAVRLERAGVSWGPARAWFVVARKRTPGIRSVSRQSAV